LDSVCRDQYSLSLNSSCISDEECESGFCYSETSSAKRGYSLGVCKNYGFKNIGESCENEGECSTLYCACDNVDVEFGYCNNFTCQSIGSKAENSSCYEDNECQNGLVCRDYFCVPSHRRNENETCEGDIDCKIGSVCQYDYDLADDRCKDLQNQTCWSNSDCAPGQICGCVDSESRCVDDPEQIDLWTNFGPDQHDELKAAYDQFGTVGGPCLLEINQKLNAGDWFNFTGTCAHWYLQLACAILCPPIGDGNLGIPVHLDCSVFEFKPMCGTSYISNCHYVPTTSVPTSAPTNTDGSNGTSTEGTPEPDAGLSSSFGLILIVFSTIFVSLF